MAYDYEDANTEGRADPRKPIGNAPEMDLGTLLRMIGLSRQTGASEASRVSGGGGFDPQAGGPVESAMLPPVASPSVLSTLSAMSPSSLGPTNAQSPQSLRPQRDPRTVPVGMEGSDVAGWSPPDRQFAGSEDDRGGGPQVSPASGSERESERDWLGSVLAALLAAGGTGLVLGRGAGMPPDYMKMFGYGPAMQGGSPVSPPKGLAQELANRKAVRSRVGGYGSGGGGYSTGRLRKPYPKGNPIDQMINEGGPVY